MNEVMQAIRQRRSCRKFKPDMVPLEVIDRIVEAGTYAASGHDCQSPIIVAVTDPVTRQRLMEANARILGIDGDPFYGAPVVLVVLSDTRRPTYLYDGCLTMGNLMLAAHAEGVASCWIHRAKQEFESEEWQEWLRSLGVEGHFEGIGHCVLGYADGPLPPARPRHSGRVYHV